MVDIPNDTTTTAVFEGFPAIGASFSGEFETFEDADWIKINLVAGTTYSFYASDTTVGAGNGDSILKLFDSAGILRGSADDGGVGDNSFLAFTPAVSGTFFVEISDGATGQYSVGVTGIAATDHFLSDAADTYTGAANERIVGGKDNDTITVGAGKDALGEQGEDTLFGNDSANFLSGGLGNDTIFGLGGNDKLFGDAGGDFISGNEGDDLVFGGDGSDEVAGGAGNDVVHGGNDVDDVIGADGADTLFGDGGNDVMFGNAGADRLDGGTGADHMSGGDDDDTYTVDNAGDIVDELGTTGTDKVLAANSFSLGNAAHVLGNVENLVLTGTAAVNGTGNALANAISGNSGANILKGAAGNDNLNGKAGADHLIGGTGADHLTGGSEADFFVYNATGESTLASRDVIFDFSSAQGDKIDLRLIDANTTLAGNQAFHFIGTAVFTQHAGELRFAAVNGAICIYGDTNGDGATDFSVQLSTLASVQAGDFLL